MYLRRKWSDITANGWRMLATSVVLLLPLSIGIGLVIRSMPILNAYSISHLLLSSAWSPLDGKFGFLPFIISSLYITVLSCLIAAPICLLASIYLTQYAPPKLLYYMHLVIDILAGIPSVVYGVWGIIVLVPFVSNEMAPLFGVSSSGYCLLTGALVLAIMCIPYILNMLIEVFKSIPLALHEAALSLGATQWEVIKKVLLRKGASGIIASIGLGISKTLGETIAVLMVVGNVAQIPHTVFKPAYPLPALIANNFGEMMSVPLYDSALMFSALILFVLIILFSALSNMLIVKTMQE